MKIYYLACVCLAGFYGCAEGEPLLSAITLGAGQACDGIDVYRLGVQKDSTLRMFPSDVGWLSLYCEASLSDWKHGGDEVYGGAFSPVFIYFFGDPADAVHPYIEAGIGAAYLSESDIGGRDFSTRFQFEDRAGVGVRMKTVDFNIRYMHYSNGSIEEPNDGMDIFMFTVGYRL